MFDGRTQAADQICHPDLLRRILSLLDKPSLACVMSVSRAMYDTAALLLYRSISIHPNFPHDPLQGRFAREVPPTISQMDHKKALLNCVNVLKLNHHSHTTDGDFGCYSRAVPLLPNLTTISLHECSRDACPFLIGIEPATIVIHLPRKGAYRIGISRLSAATTRIIMQIEDGCCIDTIILSLPYLERLLRKTQSIDSCFTSFGGNFDRMIAYPWARHFINCRIRPSDLSHAISRE